MNKILLFMIYMIGCLPVRQLEEINPHDLPIHEVEEFDLTDSSISNQLIIIAIDVGQGDSTLIITPNHKTILIDGGSFNYGYQSVLPLLEEFKINNLDYVFVSHYDSDHIAGINEVIKGKDQKINTEDDIIIQQIFDRGDEYRDDNQTIHEYLSLYGSIRKTIQPNDNFVIDNLEITCLMVNGINSHGETIDFDLVDENSLSMSLLLEYDNFSYLTSGDLTGGGKSGTKITANAEKLILSEIDQIDVLHINHHGSKTSSSDEFIENLSPTVAIISTGNENRFGHPHQEILSKLYKNNIDVYQTNQGNGGFLEEINIANESIYLFVNQGGSFSIEENNYSIP